ncbi:MogA/MoaB family molybdenum cofactor biosynthesis protein [Alicyclobacillus shizuokensis]|uniref:MogA/MoaB family molybdenum cofactor biosynthesis protein n=1 Tax=Alicyclobacillus shizuokensis TaxID=392014 RepID=UPI000835864D|nr:MogA/MoaB family molybdenum cofactor biosynthesis protein [Alicyclobacillus shizuokensis]MCL6626431.1 MogA/MoaB family molybdenum cofactor biosynthesis protein [Alicyclobacillus shizuokensis]
MDRYTAAVLTASDGVAAGTRQDKSGDTLQRLLEEAGFTVVERTAVADDQARLAAVLGRWAGDARIHLVLTTGGTGAGPRDVTPEATRQVIDKELPGVAEAMRSESLRHTPFAMTSRQAAGIAGDTVIINLPGSEKAVRECFAVIRPVLRHLVDLVCGHTAHGA